MAMAGPKSHAKGISALSYSLCFLLSTISVATLSQPALGKADRLTVELFFLMPPSTITTGAATNGSETLAATGVFSNVARASPAPDSPVIGVVVGQFAEATNGYDGHFFSYSNIVNTSRYTGTIEVQGVIDSTAKGELAITGGSGDFRRASRYVKVEAHADSFVKVKASLFVIFDCRC